MQLLEQQLQQQLLLVVVVVAVLLLLPMVLLMPLGMAHSRVRRWPVSTFLPGPKHNAPRVQSRARRGWGRARRAKQVGSESNNVRR